MRILPVAILLLLIGQGAANAQAIGDTPIYRVVKLPSHLPTQGANGAQLNDAREVVGSGIEQGWFQGVVWTPLGEAVDMEAAFGFEHSFGYAINASGAWVGAATFDATNAKERLVLRQPGQAPVFPDLLVEHPGIRATGFDISDGGLIVGACDTVPTVGLSGDPQTRATLWEAGQPRNLGVLANGNISVAYGVNDDGLVVGVSNLLPGELFHAFAWTEGSGMLELPGLSALGRSFARDVNAAGVMVGDADGPGGRSAVIWPDLVTIQPLPSLPGDFLPAANAINEHGQVVGSASATLQNQGRLWQAGVVHDIGPLVDDPGVRIFALTDINDEGVILAQGFDLTTSPLKNTAMLLIPDLLFSEAGPGVAGVAGVPSLTALGNLLPGGPLQLTLTGARASAPTYLLVGASVLGLPFAGGTIVPAFTPPQGLLIPLATDSAGELAVGGTWPSGVPTGFESWYQVWIEDPAAGLGWAASPALRAVAP